MSLIVENRYGIKIIIIIRQEKLNSLDTMTLNNLAEKIKNACQDSSVKAVMITGKGRLFSSGIDLEEVARSETPSEARKPFDALGNLLEAMINCSKPVIVYLNGPAIAGGAEIALAADITFSSPTAFISWPEIKWGLMAPMLAARLQSTPHHKLLHAALTSDKLTVKEAEKMGLIAGIYDTLDGAVKHIAETLETASKNPLATKLYLGYRRMHLKENLDKITQLARLAETPELIEKARKFLSKQQI
ncbi:MAG: enoyl-CoA hydratase/isomerase family protein [Desulfurococcales archaeon]|nr:enoyl-CoA hydratase/isomerase family protein [Desulfurococcales archaeon]